MKKRFILILKFSSMDLKDENLPVMLNGTNLVMELKYVKYFFTSFFYQNNIELYKYFC